jgi:putative DNA primase/helicase
MAEENKKIVVAEGLPLAAEDDNVVEFPGADDEQKRLLRERAEWRASQPQVEWEMYVEGDARRFGIKVAEMRRLILVVIKGREKAQREEQTILREAERKRERSEKKVAAERKETTRKERAERAEDRRARREAERRQKELERIVVLPAAEHEAELKKLAARWLEDYEPLRAEFETLLAIERERIASGEVEPWPEPVVTRVLLEELSAQIARYLVIHEKEAATIITLWICFAWCHEVATFSPILVIQSADADSAKTTACKVVSLLTPRAHVIAEPTGPMFYRFIDRYHPTMIVDDADQLLARRPDLAHIVNVSWTRNTAIFRTNLKTGHVQKFDTFCPKILSGIDLLAHLKPATRTRCITVSLLPKLESEKVTSFRKADEDEKFYELRRKLLRWANDNKATIRNATPALPTGYTNRLEENFIFLLAAADLAGGAWPKRARAAATKLTRDYNAPSLGRLLLANMRELFKHHGGRLTSEQVPELLAASGESEWLDYRGQGRAITKWEVAALLRPFGIKPKHFRRGRTLIRGYVVAQFEIAFRHFLPGGTR